MPGMFFVERWIDKFVLLSTWMDGIHNADCFTNVFYSFYLILSLSLMLWNVVYAYSDELELFDWA